MPLRILVVHDVPQVAVKFVVPLKSRAFDVDWTESRTPADVALKTFQPSLVLLDVDHRGGDSYQTCADWRNLTEIPIIGLAATGRREPLITALNLGADDCVGDQCDIDELVERIGAVVRRSMPRDGAAQFGTLRIDFNRLKVWNGETEIHDLTFREFRLLGYLARHEGKPVSRDDLLKKVWGYSASTNTRCIDHAVSRLRKKLICSVPGRQLIDMVHGCGYRLG